MQPDEIKPIAERLSEIGEEVDKQASRLTGGLLIVGGVAVLDLTTAVGVAQSIGGVTGMVGLPDGNAGKLSRRTRPSEILIGPTGALGRLSGWPFAK